MRRALVCITLLVAAPRCFAQDLGHKLLGTVGLQAGVQPKTGVRVVDQLVFYRADDLFDRRGNRVPVQLELDAVADAVGVGASVELPGLATWVNATVAVPVARVTGTVGDARASLDRFGLADVYVQPLKFGWRLPQVDLALGYGFYVPTGRFEPGGGSGVSRGSWSHELSTGGAVWFDRQRTWLLTALASYELNERKLGIDLTRGSTFQIQGGAGKTLARIFDVGLTGYALWQVGDDTGSAVPPALRGLRDRAYGLGAEAGVTVPKVRCKITLRYSHDLYVEARPLGQAAVMVLGFVPWQVR